MKRMGALFGFPSREGLNRVSRKMLNKDEDDDDKEWLANSKEYPDINQLYIGCRWKLR